MASSMKLRVSLLKRMHLSKNPSELKRSLRCQRQRAVLLVLMFLRFVRKRKAVVHILV